VEFDSYIVLVNDNLLFMDINSIINNAGDPAGIPALGPTGAGARIPLYASEDYGANMSDGPAHVFLHSGDNTLGFKD